MRRPSGAARLVVPLVALAGLLVGGCDATTTPAPDRSAANSLASCLAGLAAPATAVAPAGSATGAAPTAATGSGSTPAPSPLPGVALPCLSGTGSVRLAGLGRPAMINLWASWCAVCRVEMPAIQRYAMRAAGRVAVVGVDTTDTRTGGSSVVEDLGITYPNLFDDHRQLLVALGRTDLPVSLFVDGQGSIRYAYLSGRPLTELSIAQLVRTYLGVTT